MRFAGVVSVRERGSRDHRQCERDGRLSRVARSHDAWLLHRDDERLGRGVWK